MLCVLIQNTIIVWRDLLMKVCALFYGSWLKTRGEWFCHEKIPLNESVPDDVLLTNKTFSGKYKIAIEPILLIFYFISRNFFTFTKTWKLCITKTYRYLFIFFFHISGKPNEIVCFVQKHSGCIIYVLRVYVPPTYILVFVPFSQM